MPRIGEQMLCGGEEDLLLVSRAGFTTPLHTFSIACRYLSCLSAVRLLRVPWKSFVRSWTSVELVVGFARIHARGLGQLL